MAEQKEIPRDFKGIWISRRVWLDPDITHLEKCLLAEIDSLDSGEGCYASNAYLAVLFGCSEGRMANKITELRNRGLLKSLSFDGRIRFLRTFYSEYNSEGCVHGKREGCVHGKREGCVHGKREERYKHRKKGESREASSRRFDLVPPSRNGNFPDSTAGDFCRAYHKFLQQEHLFVEKAYKGKMITITPSIKNGVAACESLLKRTKQGEVEEVLQWYIENFRNPYVKIYSSFTQFCLNFANIQKSMFRDQKREPEPINTYPGENRDRDDGPLFIEEEESDPADDELMDPDFLDMAKSKKKKKK